MDIVNEVSKSWPTIKSVTLVYYVINAEISSSVNQLKIKIMIIQRKQCYIILLNQN